jgi:hypothetical protein
MARFINESVKGYSLVDESTGELYEYRRTRKLSLDEFIMVYFSSYPELFKLKGLQLKVLMCCWKHSTYNKENDLSGNIVHNNASFKQHCKEEGLQLSDASIDNNISALCKAGLLIKKCRGEYILNPNYFFKGVMTQRTKIQMNYVVNPEDTDELSPEAEQEEFPQS